MLAHEPSGFAIARDLFFLGKGEARIVARGLAALADWTAPIDPNLPLEKLRAAFDRGTAWRSGRSEIFKDLVWHIGDRVIAERTDEPCDCTHRIDFGWGQTYVSLGTPRRRPPSPAVLHFSARREISREGVCGPTRTSCSRASTAASDV